MSRRYSFLTLTLLLAWLPSCASHHAHELGVRYSEHLEPLVEQAFHAMDRELAGSARDVSVSSFTFVEPAETVFHVSFAPDAAAWPAALGLQNFEARVERTLRALVKATRPDWRFVRGQSAEHVDYEIVTGIYLEIRQGPERVTYAVDCRFAAVGQSPVADGYGKSDLVGFIPPFCWGCYSGRDYAHHYDEPRGMHTGFFFGTAFYGHHFHAPTYTKIGN